MKEPHQEHLRDEDILWAVIDSKDLAEDAQYHLHTCSFCSGRIEQLRTDLEVFGDKARQAVPPLSQPIRVPAFRPVPVTKKNLGWLPYLGAAAMAGLAVFLYFMGLKTDTPVKYTTVQQQEVRLQDEALMREITDLVEYPLPGDVYEIIGVNVTDYDVEDDFMDFVVPDVEDDFQS